MSENEKRKTTRKELLEETCIHLWDTYKFLAGFISEDNTPTDIAITEFLARTGWIHITIIKSGHIEINDETFPASKGWSPEKLKQFLNTKVG